MEDRAFVVSIDSLEDSDIPFLLEKENFRRLLKDFSWYSNLECPYPTYTYPCHATILTGLWPKDHGIYHNEPFDPERSETRWFWWADDLKAQNAIEFAHNKGLKVASVTWPVTAGAKGDWVIPEIWPQRGEDPDTVFLPYSSPDAIEIYNRHKNTLFDFSNPFYPDVFATLCSVDIIKEKKPDLFFLHLSALDTLRHKKGAEIEKMDEALDFLDEKIGEILDAMEESGTLNEYTFFLLGDHGQMNIDKEFGINRVLKDMGYIIDNKNWKIMAHPSSFSAEIHIKDISEEEALLVLKEIQNKYPDAISSIITKEEAMNEHHLSGPFSFVIESKGGVIFSSSLSSPIYSNSKAAATHGYMPQRGPRPPFIVSGKRGEKNKRYIGGRLIDEIPTILSLFSLKMEQCVGKVLHGLLIHPQDINL